MFALLLAAAIEASPSEQAVIFRAAGFSRNGGVWKSGNCKDAESESYEPGKIDTFRDLNGDGRPEAVVTESGAVCYGETGFHFWLLSRQTSGIWKRLFDETAMPDFLASRGVGGWPDLQLGGPGFCFAVFRWNGSAYVINRFEYEGKRCKPPR